MQMYQETALSCRREMALFLNGDSVLNDCRSFAGNAPGSVHYISSFYVTLFMSNIFSQLARLFESAPRNAVGCRSSGAHHTIAYVFSSAENLFSSKG